MSQELVKDIVRAFRSSRDEGINALVESVPMIRAIGSSLLPLEFIMKTIRALETNDWLEVGKAFVRKEFIGDEGFFLLIGPYTLRRSSLPSAVLSGVCGEAYPRLAPLDFRIPMTELFGKTADVSEVISFKGLSCFGQADGEQGEAFLVPDAWDFGVCGSGPALNNMTAQQSRIDNRGHERLLSVFSTTSTELLMKSLTEPSTAASVRQREFQFHEAGHATGLGLAHKLGAGLLPTAWHGGVEEWRADGVEFELLLRMVGAEQAAEAVAANYCLRFGVDAHRQGGIECDTDVVATMLTLNSLLRSGALYIDSNRKLSFVDESCAGLIESSVCHREQALQLTRDELALQLEQDIHTLYHSITVERATGVIFNGLVRNSCREPVERNVGTREAAYRANASAMWAR